MDSFAIWLESQWRSDVPEMEGEHWIDDSGTTMYADGNIGDMTHEAYVLDQLRRDIADKVGVEVGDEVDWEKVKQEIAKEVYESERRQLEDQKDEAEEAGDGGRMRALGIAIGKLDFLWEDQDIYPLILKGLPDHGITTAEFRLAEGNGDLRDYAMEHWGWKRVQGNNIETWTLTHKDIQAIVSGVDDIVQEIDDDQAEKLELSIFVRSNNKSFDTTLAQLGRMISGSRPQVPGAVAPQPIVPSGQIARDRHNADISMTQRASANYQRDQDLKLMHPYYRGKKFPFADWVERRHDTIQNQ